MQKLLLSLGFFFAAAASAAPGNDKIYKLSVNLAINGKPTRMTIITRASSQASLSETSEETGEGVFVDVVPEPSMEKPDTVVMNFKVGTVGKFGERKILARPQVVTREGQRAEVTSEDEHGMKVELGVVASVTDGQSPAGARKAIHLKQ